jgi:hypothetical protein
MKKYRFVKNCAVISVTTLLTALSVFVKNADAANPTKKVATTTFRKLCPTIKKKIGKAFLYKIEISDHINTSDPRASGPTLVCNRECPKFPAPLLYSDGTEAARLGYYGTWNVTGRPRAYCAAGGQPACSNRVIQSGSRSRGLRGRKRNGYIYLRMGRSGICYRINPRLVRTGDPR